MPASNIVNIKTKVRNEEPTIPVTLKTASGYQFFLSPADFTTSIRDTLPYYEKVYIYPAKEGKITLRDLLEIPDTDSFIKDYIYVIKVPEGVYQQTISVPFNGTTSSVQFSDYYITQRVGYSRYIDTKTRLYSGGTELKGLWLISFTTSPEFIAYTTTQQQLPDGTYYGKYWKEIDTMEVTGEVPYIGDWQIVFPGATRGSTYYLPENGDPQTVNIIPLRSGNDIVIFLSPQYSSNDDILAAIQTYADAVYNDLGWHVGIYKLTDEENDYITIDEIIEGIYGFYPLKGCIMCGEDIDTPFTNDIPNQERWFTRSLEDGHNRIAIPNFLMYPPHDRPFDERVNMIVNAFNKFSANKSKQYSNQSTAFLFDFPVEPVETELSKLSKIVNIFESHNYYFPSDYPIFHPHIEDCFTKSMRMVYVHGHGTRYQVLAFSKTDAQQIETPILVVSCCGCGQPSRDANNMIIGDWWGNLIFDSDHISVVSCGVNGYYGFLSVASEDLGKGKTIAEALIGKVVDYRQPLCGDPTMHFKTI